MKTSFQDLVNSKTPTVIDFFATWCGPCRMVGPILEDLKSDLGDDVRIYKIDVDQNPGLAAQYNVRSVPTIMVFKDGKLQWREAGVQSKTTLKNVISGLQG
jgi:thioredoxin 1